MAVDRTAAREELRILAILCLGDFLFFNSLGSINIALPEIRSEFGNSLAQIQWVSIIGVAMISSLSLYFGRVAIQEVRMDGATIEDNPVIFYRRATGYFPSPTAAGAYRYPLVNARPAEEGP
jgi:hypothetical protein